MSQASVHWDEDLPVDPQEEYQALVRALRRTEGFGLLFVQCSPAEGTRLIQEIQKDLPQKRADVLKFDQSISDGNVYRRVEAFLQDKQIDILFIQGLEHSLYDYEETKRLVGWSSQAIYSYSWQDVPPILMNLNQQRERFRDRFKVCFVFLVPLFVLKYIIYRAPDFFDWRSGIFELPVDQAELQSRSLQSYGDFKEYLTLTPVEQVQKLVELRNLIDAPNQSLKIKAKLLYHQGNVFSANQDFEEAIAAFNEAIALQFDVYEIFNNKGVALFELNRYEEALAAFDQALTIKSDQYEAFLNRGNALFELNRYEEALAAFDQALTIKPDDYKVLNHQGVVLLNLGRYEEALAALKHSISLEPSKYEAFINKGLVLTKLGCYEEALIAFNQAFTINSYEHSIFIGKGEALAKLGLCEEAFDAFDQAIALNPNAHDIFLNKGVVLYELAHYEKALDAFNKAIVLGADYPKAFYNKGNALFRLERYEEAIDAYDQAIAIDPNCYYALLDKGNALANLGKDEEALAFYEQAVVLKPDENRAFTSKGNVLFRLKSYEEAIDAYDQALSIKPKDLDVLSSKGGALNNLGRYKELVDTCDQVLTLKPDCYEAFHTKGNALFRLKCYEEAIINYEQALEISREKVDRKREAEYLLTLSRLYQQIGKISKGLRAGSEAVQILTELNIPLENLLYPQWMKHMIRFYNEGRVQAVLTIVGCIIVSPFFLLFLIVRYVLILLHVKIRLM
jgi:tetratricopeptide (TPR) repeat protein